MRAGSENYRLSDVKLVDLFSLPKVSTGFRGTWTGSGWWSSFGQTVIVTGKRGDGKSTFTSQILVNALDQGIRVLAYSGELPDYFFKRWMDFQAAGKHNVIDVQQKMAVLAIL